MARTPPEGIAEVRNFTAQ